MKIEEDLKLANHMWLGINMAYQYWNNNISNIVMGEFVSIRDHAVKSQ